jgi:DNA-3-methyladenine glycosylase II
MRLSMQTRPPFDLALTARVLRRVPQNPIDVVTNDGQWSRVVVVAGGAALLRARQQLDRIVIDAETSEPADRRALRALVHRVLGFAVDLEPFWEKARRDPGFQDIARRCAGLKPQRFATLFETFANAICCQQLSLIAGLTVLGRLGARFGARVDGGDRFGAPEAEQIAAASVGTLRASGLSGTKARSLQALARLALDDLERELENLDNERARRLLLELPGIGPWSADYVLLRGLGRLDIFPPGDVGASRALGRILGCDLAAAEAPAAAARFAPFQGMVYFCMRGDALTRSGDDATFQRATHAPVG